MKMDEKGVSPVIGVILMVAITVILAAVIASFVFGMGSTVQRTYNVAFTAAMVNSSHVAITFQGGPDVSYLDTDGCKAYKGGGEISGATWSKEEVGKTIYEGVDRGDVITVVCSFTPGAKQVVLTYTVK
ncbi:MAG: type IV pilin N-terminal domain-containing protein [Archaeoglobaceae archaeon]